MIYKLLSPRPDVSVLGPYIRDIIAMVTHLCGFHFLHVPRIANQVVYWLASTGLRDGGFVSRVGTVPLFISTVVNHDRDVIGSICRGN